MKKHRGIAAGDVQRGIPLAGEGQERAKGGEGEKAVFSIYARKEKNM